jgi:hypothetical protein
MVLSFAQIRRIAGDVARLHVPPLQVVAATRSGAGSSYTEVLLTGSGPTPHGRVLMWREQRPVRVGMSTRH